MAELKTKQTEASVDDFLNSLLNEQTRKDCFEIIKIMKQATNQRFGVPTSSGLAAPTLNTQVVANWIG